MRDKKHNFSDKKLLERDDMENLSSDVSIMLRTPLVCEYGNEHDVCEFSDSHTGVAKYSILLRCYAIGSSL